MCPSWFTSGRRVEWGDSYIVVDQAYVQQQPAAGSSDRPPVVFVHGGGLTGSIWESTPDGRAGWSARAVEAGWPVAVVDTVDAGRSGRAPDEFRDGAPEWKSAEQIWSRYRLGSESGWRSRTPFEGQTFPLAAFDALLAAHTARRRTTAEAEKAALVEVLTRLAPCHVVAHSYGASLLADIFDDVADMVLRAVLIEPLPFDADTDLPSDKVLLLWGDFLEQTDESRWSGVLGRYRAGSATGLDLSAAGISGVGHLPMSDLRSDRILRLVLDWLEADSGPVVT